MNEEQVCVVRRRRSRAEIERLVAEFEASGLSRSEFCRERGLALSPLGRYRRGRDRRESTSASPLLAVELSGRMQASTAAAGSALAVVLRSGRRIEVGGGFDAGALEQLTQLPHYICRKWPILSLLDLDVSLYQRACPKTPKIVTNY